MARKDKERYEKEKADYKNNLHSYEVGNSEKPSVSANQTITSSKLPSEIEVTLAPNTQYIPNTVQASYNPLFLQSQTAIVDNNQPVWSLRNSTSAAHHLLNLSAMHIPTQTSISQQAPSVSINVPNTLQSVMPSTTSADSSLTQTLLGNHPTTTHSTGQRSDS